MRPSRGTALSTCFLPLGRSLSYAAFRVWFFEIRARSSVIDKSASAVC